MMQKLMLLMSLIILAPIFFTVPVESDPQLTRPLHTEGAHFVNDRGEQVHLHGVCKNEFIESGTGLFLPPFTGATLEETYRHNLQTLQDWGCNFIALSVQVMWWVRNEQNIVDNFKFFVQLAEEYGIYVGIGVFGWDKPGAWGGPQAVREMMAAPETYKDFWLAVSNEFKDAPNLIYGSLCEVGNSGVYPELTEPDEMNQYFDLVVDVVRLLRNNGDEHPFVYHELYCTYPAYFDGPANAGGEMVRKLHEQPLDPAFPAGPKLSNVGYDAHTYRYHGTFGANPDYFDPTFPAGVYTNYDGVYQREGIMEALSYWGYLKILNEYQVPLVVWEGGANTGVSSPNSWVKELSCWQNLLPIFHELDISYGAFWWKNSLGWALIDADLSPTEWGQVLIDTIAAIAGPPHISVLSPQNRTYATTDVALTFTIDEPVSWIGYSLDGKANQTITQNVTLPALHDGSHHVIVSANNTAGNMRTSSTVHFTVDTTPPNITDVSQKPSPSNVLPQDEVEVNVTVTDYVSEVRHVILNYTNSNGTWVTIEMTKKESNIWSATIPPFPIDANITYIIKAEDTVNNTITTEDMGLEYRYRVIPEFPTALIIPLFLIVTSLAVFVYVMSKRSRGSE